jgi:hypothetical protein
MPNGEDWLNSLGAISETIGGFSSRAKLQSAAIARWRADAAAAMFHLARPNPSPAILCIIGGTGTGKSTLVNRLLQANLSAANFRRTYTAGPLAIADDADHIPQGWMGMPRISVTTADLPHRGQNDSLVIVTASHELLQKIVLVDTPDLDGDQPAHHALADRAFRWADAVLFLVSPEKYQMTELLPYYRLARRYGVTTLFLMNKCESNQMLDDYTRMLSADWPGVNVYCVARDDAAYEPARAANLSSLRQALVALALSPEPARKTGNGRRIADLLERLRDQILDPLRQQRRQISEVIFSLQAMETPPPGVDVNPITVQLQRRLQQRSVLYLIGPGRVLDRLRQMPALLVRLPRKMWDLALYGRTSLDDPPLDSTTAERELPDFPAALRDQFTILHSRIEDAIRGVPSGQRWLDDPASNYAASKIDSEEAGKIATEELNNLNDWLQRRWNATPRDTALLMKLLRHLPGGEKLTQWSEAAPYLLAIIVAAHHAIFGHVDLMILGGYSIATWLTERLSNEVASRTRQTNRTIDQRFSRLAHEQIRKTIAWLQAQAPSESEIAALQNKADQLQESLTP